MALNAIGHAAKCSEKIRPAPRRAKVICGGIVEFLVGTAKVPMCRKCAKKFPAYVPREEVLRHLIDTEVSK